MKVTIRMYRQGLGDCFLLLFEKQDHVFSMLIDCGVILGTQNAREKMHAVANSIKETLNDKPLDLLLATHEHWDHLSGFIQAKEEFEAIKLKNIWFAWTEDPDNALASKLQKDRAEKLKSLVNAAILMENRGLNIGPYKEVLEFFGDMFGANASLNTKDALRILKNKPGVKIKYCHPSEKPIELTQLPGVRIYILGPPEDEKLLKRSDPSKDKEVYELAPGSTLDESFANAVEHALLKYSTNPLDHEKFYNESDPCSPFDPFFEVKRSQAAKDPFFKDHYGLDPNVPHKNEWRKIGNDWLSMSTDLALKLDSDTNNTSLAIAIELTESGKVLLFPADAQVGNWLSWQNLSWQVEGENGQTNKVTIADLFSRTVFYKVGHHCSHNATLREKGLELMSHPDLVAMIPVDKETAMKKGWTKMPFIPLLDRLNIRTKGRLIRLDSGLPSEKSDELMAHEWENFKAACSKSDSEPPLFTDGLYIDYSVKE